MSSKYRLSKLTEDNGNLLIFKLHNFKLYALKLFSGFITKPILFIKGIKAGNNNEFFGIPYFFRFPQSKISIGSNCIFRSDKTSNLIGVNRKCIFSTHYEGAIISIGNNCGFSGTSIGAAAEIRIGNNVLCGANSIITDFDWHLDISKTKPAKVIIHDNVWIGVNVAILKGVTIGENSTIGANSLVVKDIPANVVAGGNPCKILKEISR
jgi:acetyltransferase-like isoleucine patch superfamily enzyme